MQLHDTCLFKLETLLIKQSNLTSLLLFELTRSYLGVYSTYNQVVCRKNWQVWHNFRCFFLPRTWQIKNYLLHFCNTNTETSKHCPAQQSNLCKLKQTGLCSPSALFSGADKFRRRSWDRCYRSWYISKAHHPLLDWNPTK